LTSNGKVDHRALLSKDHDVADPKQVYVAPGNAIEQAIAEIWVEILAVKRIGVHDNFFELGGHSLLATQVVNLLRRRLKVELPLRRMFEAPTIAQLAEDVARLSEMEGQVKNISRFPREGIEDMNAEATQQDATYPSRCNQQRLSSLLNDIEQSIPV
jgi:acyl carrier protein